MHMLIHFKCVGSNCARAESGAVSTGVMCLTVRLGLGRWAGAARVAEPDALRGVMVSDSVPCGAESGGNSAVDCIHNDLLDLRGEWCGPVVVEHGPIGLVATFSEDSL
jgi:hypothetical protein